MVTTPAIYCCLERIEWLQLQRYIHAWRIQNGYNSIGIFVPGEYRMVTTPGVYSCLENTEWLQLQRYIRAWRIQNSYNPSGIFMRSLHSDFELLAHSLRGDGLITEGWLKPDFV